LFTPQLEVVDGEFGGNEDLVREVVTLGLNSCSRRARGERRLGDVSTCGDTIRKSVFGVEVES
jgi:hypothetical protein